MATELYRTYEVLVEESIHPDHSKRAKDKTNKPERFKPEIDGALRDTHMILQDAVCYNTLALAGLAGNTELPDSEGEPQPLNPLWKHLTTPASKGGIKEETEKVIRRLATHYKPLAGITTAEDFLNRVYSEPLKIQENMTFDQRAAVLAKRAACYKIVEDAARNGKTGELRCEGMSPFAKTWTGLLCVGKKASIPSELPYARFSAEVRGKIDGEISDDELKRIFDAAIENYRAAARLEAERELEARFEQEIAKLQQRITKAEAIPPERKGRESKLRAARDQMQKFKANKQEWIKDRWAKMRANLPKDVKVAVSARFSKQTTASSLDLTEAEFEEAKAAATSADPASKEFFRFREPRVGRKSNREAALFRYWLLRDHPHPIVRSAAIREYRRFIEKDSPVKSGASDKKGSKKMPFSPEATYAFRFFGKHCLNLDSGSKAASSPSRELDVAAFQTAVEDVFKYKIRTAERHRKISKLLTIVGAFEGSGSLTAEESPSGNRIVGMKNDPRWLGDGKEHKGIVQLLVRMSKDKEIAGYGLRAGTIGGWAEVRKMFLRRHKQCAGREKRMAALPDWLERGVDKEQAANRQGFGSADFFHELCDPAFFHLWLEDKKDKDGKIIQKFEHNGIKDFIPYYVSYCEQRENLIGLLMQDGEELEWRSEVELPATKLREFANRPIRYTWPGLLNRHKKPSYRYYDFAGNLNTNLQLKCLFRRIRPTDNPHGFPTYKKLNGDDAKLTLSARRLMRDKIVNKDTGNSVDALWCPPLILAGEAKPTSEEFPRAGKYQDKDKKVWPEGDAEVSFSLIASPLPGDYWNEVADVPSAVDKHPVHLTISFKLEANALALLQQEGVHFVGGSLKGVDEEDEKRKFFRWPVDIESEKVAAQEAAAKAKKDAEKAGKPAKNKPRKPDVKKEELWCHFENGFRVKESRYSKAEKTKTVPEFHVLSVDLGNRFAAAFTRLRIHADPNKDGREISAEPFLPVIKAQCVHQGKLCLQGEGADVWRLVSEKNKAHILKKLRANGIKRDPEIGQYELVEEAYGNGGRGRFPTASEYDAFKTLADRLVPEAAVSLAGTDKQTYPELGDHLVFRLKRRIGRFRTLLNLIWRLRGTHDRNNNTGKYDKKREDKDSLFHKRIVIETLARSKFPKRPRQAGEVEETKDVNLREALAPDDQWQKLKDSGLLDSVKGAAENKRRQDLEDSLKQPGVWNWDKLADAVKDQIEEDFNGKDSLDQLLVAVIEFCLPLRGRHWGWDRCRKARLHWDVKDEAHTPNIQGMRGLSMKRLEQILNLRQRCQSFAKLEDRYHQQFKLGNYNPPDSVARELIDDVCPLLLERSNRIREQRVEQTAHLILAEALGMELKSPAEVKDKKARKMAVDLHGEYKRRKDKNGKEYPRCSVIVLENLERYKTSQERTKTENSRLMQWAHRAIIEKLEDMCRPFGITLMLVDPAFSSHFDARTGLPGVRVNQVSRGFHEQYPYNKWVNDKTKTGKQTQLAKDIEAIKKLFADNPGYKGELILAVEGGKEFLPVLSPDGEEGLINADICAAGNIGLRGVADPQRWDIFPRLRTKKISGTEVSVTNWRGWFGRFLKEAEERRMRAVEAEATSQAHPAEAEQKKGKKQKTKPNEEDPIDSNDLQSGQSSEYPPFFVANQKFNWPSEHDWLKKEAYKFWQDGKEVLAYPQGAYLKQVEAVCGKRIEAINKARVQKMKAE